MTVPPAPPFPDELQLQKVAAILFCWAGDPADADEALAPARALEPALDGIQRMPVAALNSAFDPLFPAGEHIAGVDPDPANAELVSDWARSYSDAARPHGTDGGYVNMMMDEGEDRVRAIYGPNYDRLAQIKGEYDPDNLFHVNQNIKPA